MSTPATVKYLIRGVPADLWRRVKARAASEGVTVRALLLRWLARYGRPEVQTRKGD